MTVNAALDSFFNSFGIDAYPETDTSAHELPCITYDAPISHFDEGDAVCSFSIWYRTESEAIPNAKAAEIAEAIGRGSYKLPVNGGYVLIRRGSPWCQPLNDENDSANKRRYCLLTLEFDT